ncbi:MAG: PIG-L family deacetylase [Planctomycetes bacterium]|nr:PIG-L family deacetylase [Planctomycetota bacterium]MCB9904901.1 PIG-L family deacetylase [Planctomycetota bacterium]
MHAFPDLTGFDELPRRVLVVAPHPDDEVLGCGGVIALHAHRGDAVRIVVCTDGGGVEHDAALAARRRAECTAACRELGVSDVVFLGFADGGLEADGLCEGLADEFAKYAPELVYAPSKREYHADHRAAAAAVAEAAGGTRVLSYGVNAPVRCDLLLDTTSVVEKKRAALAKHASQRGDGRLGEQSLARDLANTINVDDPSVRAAECFEEAGFARECVAVPAEFAGLPRATAVISSWNKINEVRANLAGVYAQTLPFAKVVVVDNASTDGTVEMIRAEFPCVHLVEMPHSRYGACETFNIGFANADTELTAILDDDIVMPPDWLAKATQRLAQEPPSTAIVSTKVVEPGMPESYRNSEEVNRERYMSTFRGCASLARSKALAEAEYYDERLFIYGNERDLTCRLLNLGYRVLQYSGAEVFHHTPFGLKPGKRSLYYHARNAWLSMLKYAPAKDLARLPWLVFSKVVLRSRKSEEDGAVTDAVGTIGIGKSLKETPGAFWIVTKAALSVLYNVPYCLKRRAPVTHDDFDLPLS